MTRAPSLSIVVPHFNQPGQLERCLASLDAQIPDRHEVEIVVCDNGSDRPPTELGRRWPEVRLVVEREPGPGPARNAGVAAARSALLAFIDADCTAAPGWIDAILAAFRDPDMQVFGGDVRVAYADPARPTMVEPYEAVFAYRNAEYIATGYSGTGNLAMRRAVFDAVGGFAGIGVAEDQDWGHRARALGYVTRYRPDMVIFHPARTYGELKGKWDRHIAHDLAGRSGISGRLRFAGKALLLLVSPAPGLARILRSERISGGRERLLAFVCLCRIRAYRAARMVRLLLSARTPDAGDWSRSEEGA